MAPTRLSERPGGGLAAVVGSLKGYQSRAAKLFLIKRIMHFKMPWCTLDPHQSTKVVIKKRAKGFRGIWLVSFDVSVCGHTGKKKSSHRSGDVQIKFNWHQQILVQIFFFDGFLPQW